MKPINVLSLFDGISCLQIALQRAGIPVDWYYASEIHEPAIEVTSRSWPDTVHIGDVREVHAEDLVPIDLLAGGSPCQNLSMAVIERKEYNRGLEGSKSKLFYEFVRLLHETKPKYFLLENVASMKNEDRDIISEVLGVQPVLIDSSVFSAQQRPRYYWTNIPVPPTERQDDVRLSDILQPAEDIPEKEWYRDREIQDFDEDKNVIGTIPLNTHEMLKRVYNPNGKCGTLTCVSGGYQEKKVWQDGCVRKLSPLEYERLQTVPDGYTEGFRDNVRRSMLGNGWTVDVISHILKGMTDNMSVIR